MTVRARVSRWGVLYWMESYLIWDDYLTRRTLPLAANTERLLRMFDDWRDLDAAANLATDPDDVERWRRVARQLVDADVLVTEASPRDALETRLLARWGSWSPAARAFHFSTRIGRAAGFVPQDEQDERFDAKLASGPAPPAYKRIPGAPRIALPDAKLPDVDFAQVLYGRRSYRVFGPQPVPLESVAALLRAAAGPVPEYGADLLDRHQTTFKTSPSGGGRHPTELYPVIRAVSDVEPGVYHYDALNHGLERLGGPVDGAAMTRLCGDQLWVADAGLLLFYTSVIARHQFKYPAARGYRNLLLDAGHLSQTVYLLVTALGLRMTFTGALRDELAEELLGVDLAEEFVVGCAVIGASV